MTDETGSSGPTSRSNHAVAVTMVAFLLAVLGFAIWQNPRQQADAPGPDPDDIAIAPTEAVDSADETPAAAVQGVDEAVAEQVATAIPDTAALPESGASGEEMQEEAGTAVEVSEAESTTEPVDTEARMDEPGEDISDVSEADAGSHRLWTATVPRRSSRPRKQKMSSPQFRLKKAPLLLMKPLRIRTRLILQFPQRSEILVRTAQRSVPEPRSRKQSTPLI